MLGELSFLLGWFNHKKHAFHANNFYGLTTGYFAVFGGGFPELTHHADFAFRFKVSCCYAFGAD